MFLRSIILPANCSLSNFWQAVFLSSKEWEIVKIALNRNSVVWPFCMETFYILLRYPWDYFWFIIFSFRYNDYQQTKSKELTSRKIITWHCVCLDNYCIRSQEGHSDGWLKHLSAFCDGSCNYSVSAPWCLAAREGFRARARSAGGFIASRTFVMAATWSWDATLIIFSLLFKLIALRI